MKQELHPQEEEEEEEEVICIKEEPEEQKVMQQSYPPQSEVESFCLCLDVFYEVMFGFGFQHLNSVRVYCFITTTFSVGLHK